MTEQPYQDESSNSAPNEEKPEPEEKALSRLSEDVRDTFKQASDVEKKISDKAFNMIQITGILLGLFGAFGNQLIQAFSDQVIPALIFALGIVALIVSISFSLSSYWLPPMEAGIIPRDYFDQRQRLLNDGQEPPSELGYLIWSTLGYGRWIDNIKNRAKKKRSRLLYAIKAFVVGLALVLTAIIIIVYRVVA